MNGVQECGGWRRWRSGCQAGGTSSCCQSGNSHGPPKPSLGVATAAVGAPTQRTDATRLPGGSVPRRATAMPPATAAVAVLSAVLSRWGPHPTHHSSHRPNPVFQTPLPGVPACQPRGEACIMVPTLQERRRLGKAPSLPKATELASGSSPGLQMPQPGACAPHPASPGGWMWVSPATQRTGWKSSLGRGERTLPV